MKKTVSHVTAVSKNNRHQNLADYHFLCNSPQKYGVYVAEKFSDGDYFKPELDTFPTRAMAYNYAKMREKDGDKIIGFFGF